MSNRERNTPELPRNEAERHVGEVYEMLRSLAERYLRGEGGYHTLQPTALVHEAYLRMLKIERVEYAGKTHFFATAARQMRRILVEHARAEGRQKRGGGRKRVTLQDHDAMTAERSIDLLALEESLTRLAARHARQARVAELRLFGGLNVAETGQVVGIAERTVKKDWRMARAWLSRELRTIRGDEP